MNWIGCESLDESSRSGPKQRVAHASTGDAAVKTMGFRRATLQQRHQRADQYQTPPTDSRCNETTTADQFVKHGSTQASNLACLDDRAAEPLCEWDSHGLRAIPDLQSFNGTIRLPPTVLHRLFLYRTAK
jgi:hypothetical protein